MIPHLNRREVFASSSPTFPHTFSTHLFLFFALSTSTRRRWGLCVLCNDEKKLLSEESSTDTTEKNWWSRNNELWQCVSGEKRKNGLNWILSRVSRSLHFFFYLNSIKLYCDSFWKIIVQNNPFIIIISRFFLAAVRIHCRKVHSEKRANDKRNWKFHSTAGSTPFSRAFFLSNLFCFFRLFSYCFVGAEVDEPRKWPSCHRSCWHCEEGLVMKIWAENNEIRFTIFSFHFHICSDERGQKERGNSLRALGWKSCEKSINYVVLLCSAREFTLDSFFSFLQHHTSLLCRDRTVCLGACLVISI